MSDIIKVRALENFKDMSPEAWPINVWLPYTEINSERFICPETQEVWHRFSTVTIFSEDEDYPDDDLIENTEELPSGLVSWHGKNGTMPQTGNTFQVFDNEDNLLFEEVISGNMRLYDREYATAVKTAPFSWEAEEHMKQAVCSILENGFKRSYDPDFDLWRASSHEPVNVEAISTTVRGIPFRVCVQEFISQKDCELLEYKNDQFTSRPFSAGGHWFMVGYSTEKEPDHTRRIGWGEGTAKEAALKLSNVLCNAPTKSSLDTKIKTAAARAVDAQSASDKLMEKREEHERD